MTTDYRLNVINDIDAERDRQDEKWGVGRTHDIHRWKAILDEEMGEVAKAILEVEFEGKDPREIRDELIQVAAVAVCIVESIDRMRCVRYLTERGTNDRFMHPEPVVETV